MKRTQGGYITLYLALTLGVMLSLIFTVLEGVRMQTIRLETEGVMDLGLHSVFGEYNRQLLEQYDLLYIDTTYGEGSPSIALVEEHLQYYMNQNFKKEKTGFFSFRDITGLRCDNTALEAYVRASDEEGQVLKRQIVDYMKGRKGINLAQDAAKNLNLLQASGMDSMEINAQWDQAHEQINELLEERRMQLSQEQQKEVQISIDNPADQVRQTRGRGILEMALPAGKTVSAVTIHPQYYFSSRQPLTGRGSLKHDEGFLEEAAGRILLQEYLFEKCGCYGKTLDKGVLAYQLEYILKRESRDDENLREVLGDILLLRQAANTAYIFSDGEKTAQAEALAAVISTLVLMPELVEPVKTTLLFAWAYAESVQDIYILLDGNKVPIQKDGASWNISLLELMNFTAFLDNYHSSGQGMDYQDFLKAFLYLRGEKKVLEGFMDICEMDIRLTPGNEYFQMDGCLEAIRAEANVTSSYGYSYEITRTFYY
ncbi:MAG: DUF5702 domain-containing protein [Lachnospiraceae bacterium]